MNPNLAAMQPLQGSNLLYQLAETFHSVICGNTVIRPSVVFKVVNRHRVQVDLIV